MHKSNSTNTNSLNASVKQMEHVYYAKLVNFERQLQHRKQQQQQQQQQQRNPMASPEDTNIEIVVEKNGQFLNQHNHRYNYQNRNTFNCHDGTSYLKTRIHNLNNAIGSSTLLYDNDESDYNEEEEMENEDDEEDEELNNYACKTGRIEHIIDEDDCDENNFYKMTKFKAFKSTMNRKSNKVNPIIIENSSNDTANNNNNNMVFSSSSLSSLSCSNNSIDNCLNENSKKLTATNKNSIVTSSASSSSASLSPLENAMRLKMVNEQAAKNGVSNEFYGSNNNRNSSHIPIQSSSILLKTSENPVSSSSPTSSSSSSYSKSASSSSSSSSSSSQRIVSDKENNQQYSQYSLIRTQVTRTQSIVADIETNGSSINKGAMGIIHKSLHTRIENFNDEDANDQVDQINIFNLRLNRVANNKSGNLGKIFCLIQIEYPLLSRKYPTITQDSALSFSNLNCYLCKIFTIK